MGLPGDGGWLNNGLVRHTKYQKQLLQFERLYTSPGALMSLQLPAAGEP